MVAARFDSLGNTAQASRTERSRRWTISIR